ncbi:hypothetical protein Pelo_12430 [Pelomyxa schiedti]|nr:hypothetical protein Pelo_12430 [Pelomyxa schiedti]
MEFYASNYLFSLIDWRSKVKPPSPTLEADSDQSHNCASSSASQLIAMEAERFTARRKIDLSCSGAVLCSVPVPQLLRRFSSELGVPQSSFVVACVLGHRCKSQFTMETIRDVTVALVLISAKILMEDFLRQIDAEFLQSGFSRISGIPLAELAALEKTTLSSYLDFNLWVDTLEYNEYAMKLDPTCSSKATTGKPNSRPLSAEGINGTTASASSGNALDSVSNKHSPATVTNSTGQCGHFNAAHGTSSSASRGSALPPVVVGATRNRSRSQCSPVLPRNTASEGPPNKLNNIFPRITTTMSSSNNTLTTTTTDHLLALSTSPHIQSSNPLHTTMGVTHGTNRSASPLLTSTSPSTDVDNCNFGTNFNHTSARRGRYCRAATDSTAILAHTKSSQTNYIPELPPIVKATSPSSRRNHSGSLPLISPSQSVVSFDQCNNSL